MKNSKNILYCACLIVSVIYPRAILYFYMTYILFFNYFLITLKHKEKFYLYNRFYIFAFQLLQCKFIFSMEIYKCRRLSSTMWLANVLYFWMHSVVLIILVAFTIPASAVGKLTESSIDYETVGPLKLKNAWKFIRYEGSENLIANLTSSGEYVAGASFPLDVQGKSSYFSMFNIVNKYD